MQQNKLIPLFLVWCSSLGCANHQPAHGSGNDSNTTDVVAISPPTASFETGKLLPNVVCSSNVSQSYSLYIPYESGHALPVIFFFDPHAHGELPLSQYKALADKYGFILAGSNNSKNGNDLATAENIWKSLSADVVSRAYADTTRIYTCGFSGGAKVATEIALNHAGVKGVIANSAVPDGRPLANYSFSFTGIAGDGDMNMTDVVSYCNSLDKTKTHHRMILFSGKHEWAPVTTMDIAFEGLVLDAMRNKQVASNNSFIENYIAESEKRIDEFVDTGNYIKAVEECKLSMDMLEGLTDATSFKTKSASFASNPLYQKQLKQQQQIFATEENTKAFYQQQFQQADINFWTSIIKDLNNKANAQTNEGAMYKRLLAYLSLSFYSFSNQLINAKHEQASYYVELYKLADPTNSEAWYFSAIINARNSDSHATEEDLLKAVANGFNDKQRLEQQQDFQVLSPPVNLALIEGSMKE